MTVQGSQNEMGWAGASLPYEDTTTCDRSAPARTQILRPSKLWASMDASSSMDDFTHADHQNTILKYTFQTLYNLFNLVTNNVQ